MDGWMCVSAPLGPRLIGHKSKSNYRHTRHVQICQANTFASQSAGRINLSTVADEPATPINQQI